MTCSNTSSNIDETSFKISTSKVTDEHAIAQVKQFLLEENLNGSFKKSATENIDFDIASLQLVSREDLKQTAYLISEKDSNINDKTAFQLGIFSSKERINGAIIVKTEYFGEHFLAISYIDLNGELIQKIEIDNKKESISFLYDSKLKSADCGSDTAHCIADMYTELGWGSVSWWVGTALFGAPWAIGTALGCTYAMCLQ